MKKFLIISVLILFSACANKHAERVKKSPKQYTENFTTKKSYRFSSKFSNQTKPSESMQAGISKQNNRYIFSHAYKSETPVEVEDNDFLLDGNGEYIGQRKVGNPYQIFGVSYFPQDYDDYEEIGIASWYGDDFHGKLTANGEVYDMDSMTAAHPTLPLPSMVRVTNLGNGKSVIVRVNDRGPFAKSRVIDVSEKAAILLDFKNKGTAEVKVELLQSDTEELLEKLKISKN